MTTGRQSMEKQELARTVIKNGADMLRIMEMAKEIDGKVLDGYPIYETTADGLLAATIRYSDSLDQYEALMEQQEQHAVESMEQHA